MENSTLAILEQEFLELLYQNFQKRVFNQCLEQFQSELTTAMEGVIEGVLARTWTKVANLCLEIQYVASSMHANSLADLAYECSVMAKRSNKSKLTEMLPILFLKINKTKEDCQTFLMQIAKE